MKSQIFLGLIVFFILFSVCFLPSFAYYNFLSPECNIYLEKLKEKFREKEIVLEKEEGIVWIVELSKNDRVKVEEIKEGFYTFTRITILNARGWTKVIWGFASKFHPYDVPKLCFVYDG